MATSISVTTRINAFRAMFAADGTPSVHIDYSLLDATGNVVGGGTHSLYNTGAHDTDPFTTDGKTDSFTTLKAPYGGVDPTVVLDGKTVTSGITFASNTNGTVTVTFATTPTASSSSQPNLQLLYPTGPSLTNAAGDLPSVLSLSDQTTGPIYQDASGTIKTSHKSISEFAAVVLGWAKIRVEQDKLG